MKHLVQLLTIAVFILPLSAFGAEPLNCIVTVVDTNGRPIQNAQVSVWGHTYDPDTMDEPEHLVAPTNTDAAGKASFQCQVTESENSIFIVARKDGFAMGWCGVHQTAPVYETHIVLDRINPTAGIVTDEANRPITGAKVTAYPYDDVMVEGARSDLRWANGLTTVTDHEGRFNFDCLAEWMTVKFTCEYPGRAFTDTQYNLQGEYFKHFKSGTKDIHIVMHPGGQIKGTVLAKRGVNVSGLKLFARGENIRTGKRFMTITDPDGNFLFKDLPPDIYMVSLAVKDDINQLLTIGARAEISEPGQTVDNVKIRLREPIVMEVTVNDAETGGPIPNADVWLYQRRVSKIIPHLDFRTTTDSRGVAQVLALPGKCDIGAGHDDYDMRYGDYLVRTTDKNFNIVLPPHRVVNGQVMYEDGRPAAHVEVSTSTHPTEYKVTDRNGRFRIQYSDRTEQKRFCIARDRENNLAGIVDITENDEPVKIVLALAARLKGRVVDTNNDPVHMARVKVIYHVPHTLLSSGNDLYTDENGYFQLSAVPYAQPDFSHCISASAYGYSKIEFQKIELKDEMGQTVELPPLVLNRQNTTITGVAVYPDGSPAARKHIHLDSPFFTDSQTNLHSVTEENGTFQFEGACSDWLRIQCGSIMQNDFGFLYAKGGDTVTVVMDKNYDSLQTHTIAESLTGKTLPMLDRLTNGIDPNTIDGKQLLFCFWWISEEQGKTTILKLSRLADELGKTGIAVILINARPYSNRYASVNIGLDAEWFQKNKIPFPEADIPDITDIMEVRRAAGARFIPHLLLTDENKTITADGFDIDWLRQNVLKEE